MLNVNFNFIFIQQIFSCTESVAAGTENPLYRWCDECVLVFFQWVFKRPLNEDKPPAVVTDFELCLHNSKSGRNYAEA